MAHLYRTTEWEDAIGNWNCGDVSSLGTKSNTWWYPCNILNLTPVEFVKFLIQEFKAVNFHYNTKADVLIYSFKTQSDCRKYKNFINKKAREKNFIVP